MSAASRQKTCAVCGALLLATDRTSVEPLIDGQVRYVAVHWNHHTFPTAKGCAR